MTEENTEFIEEPSEQDQADLRQLFAEPEPERVLFRPILFIWREVLKPAADEQKMRPTPQWATRIISSYRDVGYGDMYAFRDLYYARIKELADLLSEVIESDEDCLTYTTPEEDVEHNSGHYKDLLVAWQLAILQWELDWDCLHADAAVDLAAIAEAHKMFFDQNGLTQYLENIPFDFTDQDKMALAEALTSLRDGVTGE
jgi:hypothetical protein